MLMPWSIGKCFYLSFVSARALLAIALVPPTHALSPAFANYQHDLKIVRSCLCRGTLASSSKYSLTSAPCLARFCPRPAHPRNLTWICKLSSSVFVFSFVAAEFPNHFCLNYFFFRAFV